MTHPHNPFSTSEVRPGAIPYLTDEGFIDEVTQRWQHAGWIGQLVGPHGVGKSSLAMAMEAKVANQFHASRRITIRSDRIFGCLNRCDIIGNCLMTKAQVQRTVSDRQLRSDKFQTELWIVDGLERLTWLHRWLLVHYCRQREFGLLVTSHRRLIGIPVLATLTPSLQTFRNLSEYLLASSPCQKSVTEAFDATTIEQAYDATGGNVREALMLLYDRFEAIQRRQFKRQLATTIFAN